MIAAVWASPQLTQTNRTKLVTLWDCDPEAINLDACAELKKIFEEIISKT